jgi:hypothetical protein
MYNYLGKIFMNLRLPLPVLFFIFILLVSNSSQSKVKLDFSHEHGFYYSPFVLTISCDTPGVVIKYTIDGSNPLHSGSAKSSSSPLQITIDPSVTTGRDKAPGYIVTACALLSDTLASGIITRTFIFPGKIIELSPNNQVPGSGWLTPGSSAQQISYGLDPYVYNNTSYSPYITEAFTTIPTLSLVTDLKNLFDPDSGIYVNAFYHGEEWEREASLELINPDSSKGFQSNCGIRIRGGWSRHFECPKRSFRVFFRSEYGNAALNYPIYGDEGASEYDKFDIQTSMNYSWSYYGDASNTFLREIFSRDTQRDMGEPYTRGKFYHLYINGTYWGLFQIQERAEANYGTTYFGGTDEDYDVIKVDVGQDFNLYKIEATDGTLDKWRELWETGQTGFADNELYYKVQGLNPDGTKNPEYEKLLDVDNLIDYELSTFFVGDFDAPVSWWRGDVSPNNFYAIYNRVNPDGFKFFRHDAEHTMFNNSYSIDRTGPFTAGQDFMDSNPQWIHQKLCDNPHYKLRFADRVYKHMFSNGALTKENNIARINQRKSQIEYAIIAESARWGDSKISPARTKADWTSAVNYIVQDYLSNRNDIVLQQLKNKGLFTENMPPDFNKNGGVVDKGFNVQLNVNAGDIYYTTDGNDPCLQYTETGSSFSKTVVSTSSNKKVIVPQDSTSTAWRTDISFNDPGWLTCSSDPGGIGYETGTGYESLISLSLENYMYRTATNANNTCYIRIPFELTSDELSKINNMNFQIRIDDAFIAYINGNKVAASDNAPITPKWNSAASTSVESSNFMSYDISSYVNLLHAGTNLLAIQGMNNSTASSDLLILPILKVGKTSPLGGVSPTAVKYNGAFPISKTTTIRTRTLFNSNWSALSEATFVIDEDLSPLKITELNYHPLGQDTTDGDEFEFIELKNVGSNELVLTGASFIKGIDYTFGEVSVLPDKFIVLASNRNEFYRRYGFMPFDQYSGRLDNGGERVVFVDAAGDTVLNFKYNDKLPWPVEADGQGYSLVSKSVFGTGIPDNADYWLKSAAINGSPGTNDAVSAVNDKNMVNPRNFELKQNYPNPFNPITMISYQLPVNSNVTLKLFDVLGKEVATLVNEKQNPGIHHYTLSISNYKLSSGVYFYQLRTGDFNSTKKMILMK